MKKTFFFLILGALFQTQIAGAVLTTCEKQYGQTVAYCAQGLDALSPNMRAGAQKACVQDAKVAKDACLSGVNICLNNCQTSYTNNVTACEQTYDPNLCLGNPDCQQEILQQRADCTTVAVDTLNACNATCQ